MFDRLFENRHEVPLYIYVPCMMLAAFLGVMLGSLPVAILDYYDQQKEREQNLSEGVLPPTYGAGITPTQHCANTVTRVTVPAGGTVWTAISNQVWRSDPDMTAAQHEREVLRLTVFMQSQIDLTPEQTVRNLDVVPAGYTFFMTEDSGIFLPGEW